MLATAQKNRILNSYLFRVPRYTRGIRDMCTKLIEKSVRMCETFRYIVSEREVGFSM